MAIDIISKALLSGYTFKSILKSVAKKYPNAGKYVNAAEQAGFLAPSILKKLMNPEGESAKQFDTMTEHERTLHRDKKQRRDALMKVVGTLGTAGAIAAGAYKLFAKGAPAEAIEAAGQAGGGGGGAPPPAAAVKPLTKAGLEEDLKKIEAPKVTDLSTKLESDYPHVRVSIDKMLKEGKTPEEVYTSLRRNKLLAPIISKMEEAAGGMPYLERIKRFAKAPGTEEGLIPSQPAGLTVGELRGQPSVAEEPKLIEEPKAKGPIGIGEKAATPEGIVGSVTHSKLGNSILDVNGKKRQVKTDTLEPLPKEWDNIHVDLSKVPEEARSAPISFFAATPDRSKVLVRFWQGHKPMIYMYGRKDGKPIDEETLNSIANETDAPITNGMKFSGAWSQSGKSRGGALHQRLKLMAQPEEEPDDPSKPFFFIRVPITFEHGFLKATHEKLLEAEKRFDEFHKKGRKKKV